MAKTKDGFTRTDYVVKCGKQPVFSGNEGAARAKINAGYAENAAQGTENKFTLTRREIFYPGVDKQPEGDDSRITDAKVTEEVID